MFLDYSLKTLQERKQYVEKLINDTPDLSSSSLTKISDYLLFVTDKNTTKQQKKEEYPIETANRALTIDKRQTSLEQIISSLDAEAGEDKFYALINTDKHQFLDPREKITDADRANPVLAPLLKNIETYKKQMQQSVGRKKFALKNQIIETYQEIYTIKSGNLSSVVKNSFPFTDYCVEIPEHITFDENGFPHSDALISLMRADHVALLLKYYQPLRSQLEGKIYSDLYWIMNDLDSLINQTLRPHPIFLDLVYWKIERRTNEEINARMREKYKETHTDQYWSTLWKQRIPKMIAAKAQENYIMWYHTNVVRSEWKKCTKCGQVKLAHPLYFSRNGNKFYSICKECRNKKHANKH